VILGIAFLALIILVVWGKQDKKEFDSTLKLMLMTLIEQSYADGQVDALTGDVRIKQINDSAWVYIKSPWSDSGAVIKDTIIHKH
jgi:hypothetical protein